MPKLNFYVRSKICGAVIDESEEEHLKKCTQCKLTWRAMLFDYIPYREEE